jgi:hypothetical protein
VFSTPTKKTEKEKKDMTIKANVEEKKKLIETEMEASKAATGAATSATADDLKRKGLDAILGGPVEWVRYMKEFAKTPEELARLIPTDGTHDRADMNDARAYLIANAPCTPETVSKLIFGVTDILDQ